MFLGGNWQGIFLYSAGVYSDKKQRIMFNFTFVKWAAEFAHFRVISEHKKDSEDEGEEAHSNWNVNTFVGYYDDYAAFDNYDQSLGHKISNDFNRHILVPNEQIDKKAMDQILQLAFSFAIRILLCDIYDEELFYYDNITLWQLKTLLLAYKKIMSPQNFNENDRIFPFKLIEIDEDGNHWWAQSLSPKDPNWSAYSPEQQQFIVNFKFVFELFKYKMASYVFKKNDHKYILRSDEVQKLFDEIMNKRDKKENAPAIYNFLKKNFDIFLSKLSSSELQKLSKIGDKTTLLKCLFISVGRELNKRFNADNANAFTVDDEDQQMCGADVHIKYFMSYHDNNTPSEGSTQLEMALFKEPLWNYTRVIGVRLSPSAFDYDLSSGCLTNLTHNWGSKIAKFGQTLYEILKNHSEKVEYDEKQQLLTFPLPMGQRIVRRLSGFVELHIKNLSIDRKISDEFDFLKTLKTVVSTENGQMVVKKCQNTISMFGLLFSFAFRLCMQIGGQNDDFIIGKYAPNFKDAWKICFAEEQEITLIFDYKMKLENETVHVYLPNWNLPYFVYSEKENELKAEKTNEPIMEKAKENFDFLRSNYLNSTNLYDVINMAQIVNKMPDNDHILVTSSDPATFLFLLNYVNKNNPLVSEEINDCLDNFLNYYIKFTEPIKVPVKGRLCILVQFVKDLLAKIREIVVLPNFKTVDQFENSNRTKFCTEDRLKEENMKIFGENEMNFDQKISSKISLHKEPNEVEKMKEKLKKLQKDEEKEGEKEREEMMENEEEQEKEEEIVMEKEGKKEEEKEKKEKEVESVEG